MVELDPKDAEQFQDLLIPLSSGNKPVTPLRNDLKVVLEGDLTQNFVEEPDLKVVEEEPTEQEESAEVEGLIDLAGESEKKPRRKKKAK